MQICMARDKSTQLVIQFFVSMESVIYRRSNEMNINTKREREHGEQKKEMIRGGHILIVNGKWCTWSLLWRMLVRLYRLHDNKFQFIFT